MVAPLSPEQARLAAIREALPATAAGIYLNTAAAGPLPTETARVMAELAASELTLGRGHPQDPLETLERVGEARAALAAVLGADLQAVALTRGTDHGLALALAATGAGPDRTLLVLQDAAESPAAWPIAARTTPGRVVSVVVSADEDDDVLVGRIGQACVAAGAQVGAVILPLITPWTGRRLPVERLAAAVRATIPARVVVDGGCAVGAVPVDPTSLGADALVFPSERWLLGPAGLGGLWSGPEMLDRIRTMQPVAFGDGFTPGTAIAHWLPGAASLPRTAVTGVARSAGWLAMQVGLPWAWARTSRLVRSIRSALQATAGVNVLSPGPASMGDPAGAIVSFSIDGWTADEMLEELSGRIFLLAAPCRMLAAVRISIGAWTSEEELERLLSGVRLLAAHTPATIPPRRTLNVLP